MPRTVGNGQQVRNIQLHQDGTTRHIALWNANTSSPVKAGDRVTITHVSPKKDNFLKELALSTTAQTEITVSTTFEIPLLNATDTK